MFQKLKNLFARVNKSSAPVELPGKPTMVEDGIRYIWVCDAPVDDVHVDNQGVEYTFGWYGSTKTWRYADARIGEIRKYYVNPVGLYIANRGGDLPAITVEGITYRWQENVEVTHAQQRGRAVELHSGDRHVTFAHALLAAPQEDKSWIGIYKIHEEDKAKLPYSLARDPNYKFIMNADEARIKHENGRIRYRLSAGLDNSLLLDEGTMVGPPRLDADVCGLYTLVADTVSDSPPDIVEGSLRYMWEKNVSRAAVTQTGDDVVIRTENTRTIERIRSARLGPAGGESRVVGIYAPNT